MARNQACQVTGLGRWVNAAARGTLAAALLGGLLLLGAPGASAAPKVEPVPTFACAVANGDATFTYFFGYELAGADAVDLPVGSSNHVTPGNEDQGQPTRFEPGSHAAFSVTTSGTRLVWHLGRTNLVATSSALCSSPPVVSESARRILLPLAAALPLSVWFVRSRRRATHRATA